MNIISIKIYHSLVLKYKKGYALNEDFSPLKSFFSRILSLFLECFESITSVIIHSSFDDNTEKDVEECFSTEETVM